MAGSLDLSLHLARDSTGFDSDTGFGGICGSVQRNVGVSEIDKASGEGKSEESKRCPQTQLRFPRRAAQQVGSVFPFSALFLVRRASLGFPGLGAFPDH